MGHRYMTTEIVCYTGGTCGDIVVSLLDPSGSYFDSEKRRMSINSERSVFKKPHLYTDDEKDNFLSSTSFKSIPSHDIEYHIRKHHEFIGIKVANFDTAVWAATRFKELHRPHVWAEMQNFCGASTVNDYAQMMIDFGTLIDSSTNRILYLEDIISGKALEKLSYLITLEIPDTAPELYNQWLLTVI